MYQSGHKVTEMIKFCSVVPNIFGSEKWNLKCELFTGRKKVTL